MGNDVFLTGPTATPNEIAVESMFFCGGSPVSSHREVEQANKPERRHDQRRAVAYPALVRGVDACGQIFEEFTHIDNISSGGLFLRLPRQVVPGGKLFLTFRFSHTDLSLPRLAIRGVVRRITAVSDDVCGVGIELTQRRLLDKDLRNFSKKRTVPARSVGVNA